MNPIGMKTEYRRINSGIINNNDRLNAFMNYDHISRYLNRREIRYLLQHWYYYEHDLLSLNNVELNNAKALFYRLSYLTKADRDVLAYLYHHENISDFPNNEKVKRRFKLSFTGKSTDLRNSYIDKLKRPRKHPRKPDEIDSNHDRVIELLDELHKLMIG